MSKLLLLHLDEPDGVQPADSEGHLGGLAVQAGIVAPPSVSTWSGKGKSFTQAGTTGLFAADLVAGETLTIRDVTIRAIVALTLTGAAGPQTIISRGLHDGTANEPYAYGLEVEEQAGHPGFVEVRLFWEDSAGAIHTQPPGVFQHLGDGKYFLLTATRRWEATNRVITRYYVGDELIAEVTTTDGDIAGATTSHTSLGARKNGGAWGRYLNGVIDELEVLDVELSHEEIREGWRRLAVHQPAGVQMFTGLMPPGAPWYKDPGNNVGRGVRIAGEALGAGVARIEELRALWLPDACTLDNVGRWEALCGLTPRPRDSLDVRRARIVGFLSRDQGFSKPALQVAFAEPMGLAASDVQILEFSNTMTDGFAALAAERWWTGEAGVWSIVAGELKIHAVNGTDLRWDPTRATSWVITPMAQDAGKPFIAQVKLSTYWASLPTNTMVGLFLFSYQSGSAIWFGVKDVGGVRKVGYHTYQNGVLGAFVTLVTPSLDQAYWLRVLPPTAPIGGVGSYKLGWSTTGPTTGFAEQQVVTGISDLAWAGVAAMSTAAAMGSDLNATFDDFVLRSIDGDRPFVWYAFRDPALPGNCDLAGTEQLALKLRPAHTYAGATESKSVLCDDLRDGLCDHGPMGGL